MPRVKANRLCSRVTEFQCGIFHRNPPLHVPFAPRAKAGNGKACISRLFVRLEAPRISTRCRLIPVRDHIVPICRRNGRSMWSRRNSPLLPTRSHPWSRTSFSSLRLSLLTTPSGFCVWLLCLYFTALDKYYKIVTEPSQVHWSCKGKGYQLCSLVAWNSSSFQFSMVLSSRHWLGDR